MPTCLKWVECSESTENEDYEELQNAFSEMHRLMDEVRLRQQQMAPLSAAWRSC